MKGVIRNALLVGTMALMSACPTMTTVAERETYAELKWYAKCKQIDEGGFPFGTDYVYACGKGKLE